jgi:hypothetical protein
MKKFKQKSFKKECGWWSEWWRCGSSKMVTLVCCSYLFIFLCISNICWLSINVNMLWNWLQHVMVGKELQGKWLHLQEATRRKEFQIKLPSLIPYYWFQSFVPLQYVLMVYNINHCTRNISYFAITTLILMWWIVGWIIVSYGTICVIGESKKPQAKGGI